jgi:hypothetical protein
MNVLGEDLFSGIFIMIFSQNFNTRHWYSQRIETVEYSIQIWFKYMYILIVSLKLIQTTPGTKKY